VDSNGAIVTDSADGTYYDEGDQRGRNPAKKFTQIFNPSGTTMFMDNVENMFEAANTLFDVSSWHPLHLGTGHDPTGYLEILRHNLGANSAYGDGAVHYFKADEVVHATASPGGTVGMYTGGAPGTWWSYPP
jgi:hypothetical protein